MYHAPGYMHNLEMHMYGLRLDAIFNTKFTVMHN